MRKDLGWQFALRRQSGRKNHDLLRHDGPSEIEPHPRRIRLEPVETQSLLRLRMGNQFRQRVEMLLDHVQPLLHRRHITGPIRRRAL